MLKRIDLTCPAEIFRTALPTEEIPAATMTLFNLSDRVISSVEVMLRLLDAAGNEHERLTFRGRALNGRPHSTFLLTVPCAPAPGFKGLDVTIEKVWFADNDTWRRDPAAVVEYEPNELPVSPALTKLKYAAGETAVGYPSLQNGLWVCVCGRPNPEGEPACARCGQERDVIFTSFTPEAVETRIALKQRQLDLTSRNMREDTIRLQRIREEEYHQKKKRRSFRIRILAAMLLSLALTAAVIFYGAPEVRLLSARRALETGNAAGAKATLLALGSYGRAEELIEECDWQLAYQAADSCTGAEEMAEAAAGLRSVSGRPEAAAKADELDMVRSRLLLADQNWKDALEALALVPADYPGRDELERDCLAAEARSLQREGDYEGARKVWLSLGDYEGAREQAARCAYDPASALMDEGDWDGAIELFALIPDYSDSREMTLKCHYNKAQALLDAGDVDGAINEFLLAGTWSDAPVWYRFLVYQKAEALYDAKDYQAAQALYASIPDFDDSNEKEQACRYRMAVAAADDMEYTMALELFRTLPDDYRDTAALRAEAAYHKAKACFSQGDWKTAAELLRDEDREALRRKFRDAESLYREACEKAGIEAYPPETETPAATPEPTPTPTPTPAPTPVPTPTLAPDETPNPFLVTEDEGV